MNPNQKNGWLCPSCGTKSMSIDINKNEKNAKVKCSLCNIDLKINTNNYSETIDIYGDFIDLYHENIEKKNLTITDLQKGFLEF